MLRHLIDNMHAATANAKKKRVSEAARKLSKGQRTSPLKTDEAPAVAVAPKSPSLTEEDKKKLGKLAREMDLKLADNFLSVFGSTSEQRLYLERLIQDRRNRERFETVYSQLDLDQLQMVKCLKKKEEGTLEWEVISELVDAKKASQLVKVGIKTRSSARATRASILEDHEEQVRNRREGSTAC